MGLREESAASAWYRGARPSAYFDSLARNYGDGGYYGKRRQAVIAALGPRMRDIERLLDLGAGNGAYLAAFASWPGLRFLAGIDLSAGMLAEARRRLGTTAVPLVRADALALPLAAASFDAVFCSHVLQLLDDVRLVMSEISRVLRPHGRLIATFGVSRIGEALRRVMGAENYQALEAVAFGRRSEQEGSHSEQFYRDKFAAVALRAEVLDIRFKVNWADVDEWLRLRWFAAMTPAERAQAEEILAKVGANVAPDIEMEFLEPVMIGTR